MAEKAQHSVWVLSQGEYDHEVTIAVLASESIDGVCAYIVDRFDDVPSVEVLKYDDSMAAQAADRRCLEGFWLTNGNGDKFADPMRAERFAVEHG